MRDHDAWGMECGISDSFEAISRLYWQSPPNLQQAALSACSRILRGQSSPPSKNPRLSLKELGQILHRHPSVLWRLGVVKHCGESFGGGRKLYRENEVVEYLKSGTALKYRAALRQKRKTINT